MTGADLDYFLAEAVKALDKTHEALDGGRRGRMLRRVLANQAYLLRALCSLLETAEGEEKT